MVEHVEQYRDSRCSTTRRSATHLWKVCYESQQQPEAQLHTFIRKDVTTLGMYQTNGIHTGRVAALDACTEPHRATKMRHGNSKHMIKVG
jgi:hypothetical protein